VLPGDFRHIAVSSSADDGETYSQPVIVSDDRWQIAGCPVSGPALAVEADGALRVLWYSEGQAGEAGLYWSQSVDGGRTFAPRRLLSGGQASGTPTLLVVVGNTPTAIWGMGGSGSARLIIAKLDGDGQVIDNIIATTGDLPSAATLEGKLFIAYILKSGGRRSIWLASAKQNA
jgi:hypothetical protein